jgi:hypothetical protein
LSVREIWTYDIPFGSQQQVPKTMTPKPKILPLPQGHQLFPYGLTVNGARKCLQQFESSTGTVRTGVFSWLQQQSIHSLNCFVARLSNFVSISS